LEWFVGVGEQAGVSSSIRAGSKRKSRLWFVGGFFAPLAE
jgi:hypothetical protein